MTQQQAGGGTHKAIINGTTIEVAPKETVLQAALRQGIDFPHSCRVGGCGTCRCRLAAGEVRELTETGYLLSSEELERRTILACQSVPKTDVTIEVDLARGRGQSVSGLVIGWTRLTSDIVALRIQLDEPMTWRAGQHARLSLEGVEGVERTYSFATPPTPDNVATFFVRAVPGGRFSTWVNAVERTGVEATVRGPFGAFVRTEGDGPLLHVAGGSGLAPLLAMLQEALDAGDTRPVTLLFGARTAADLYALDKIDALARAWPAPFTFIPILSEEPADSAWTGHRGRVTDILGDHVVPGCSAFLCGPPGMIDAATDVLRARGVPAANIRVDRFTTDHDATTAVPAAATTPTQDPAGAPANLLHYLKFFGFHAIGLLALAALLAGGTSVTIGLVSILGLYILGDAICGNDTTTPEYRHPRILTFQLWLALPLLTAIVFLSVWTASPGDPLGFGAWASSLTGFDLLAAREATGVGGRISAWILTGLMIGMVGTITAHELTHRTWDPISMIIGRWLLAFSFDTIFAIEHVYGHHRYVSTTHDPATAPRGRNVYAHIVSSTIRGNVSAWHIETDRLRKRKLPIWSHHNAFLRGHLMSVLLVLAAGALGGLQAAAFFIACALWGKSLLEIVNYMEHYGMVRDPATPVQPRHSWNTNRRISSWTMFNLTRHSHHHAQGEVPYHELRPFPDAPVMINGYLTTIVIALVPPLWHHLMTPKVLDWDRRFASPDERRLAAEANARSGIPALMQAANAERIS